MAYRWTTGEPRLREVLRDDVVLAVMNRDGVSLQELDELIRSVQRQLDSAAQHHDGRAVFVTDSPPSPRA